jgi:hypothetical protein
MEISRQNYEQYFVDYLDGKLNEKQVGILMSFLEFNPDLKEEFADIEKMCLAPDETKFSGKAKLLKSESDFLEETILKDFDMYCISSMERDIADEDEEILQDIVGDDPDKEHTYILYQSTRLLPDESIIYPGKARLKKRFIPLPYRIILPAAAAVAALIILLQVFTTKGPEVYNATQTFQSPETPNDNQEISSPPAMLAQTPEKAPSLTREEKSTGKSLVSTGTKLEKGSPMADRSIADVEENTSRANIQLTRIESKDISGLGELNSSYEESSPNHLALKQTNRPPENDDAAEISAYNPKLSLWILADASVRGLNSVAEDEYHLDRKKDKNGKTRRITFDTPVFGISAPVRKPDKKQ